MVSDGRQLEGLVSYVEKTMLPQGFEVNTNERVYNDEGVQIAEFDIEIRGKLGSTIIAWLIECRDRPGQGPASGSWIEQLVGRRTRFGFNKVTAVSTTGFSAGAIDFAKDQGIELREVKALSAEEFSDWLLMRHIQRIERVCRLDRALVIVNENERQDKREKLEKIISSLDNNSKFLRSTKTGDFISLLSAFLSVVTDKGDLFDDLAPNGIGKKIRFEAQYTDSDHFVIDTELGEIRVEKIVFWGELSLREELVPLADTAEYRQMETGETISQVASFAPQSIHGVSYSLEFHRIAGTGETSVILRKLLDKT